MERKELSTSRRFRIASHGPADRYGYVESSVNAHPLLDARDTLHRNGHTDVTVEHLFVKALADPIRNARYLNGRFVCGSYYEFDTVDIATVVTREEGRDMSIIKHENVPKTTIDTLAETAKSDARRSQAGERGEETRSRMIHALPIPLLRTLVRTMTWLNEYWGARFPPRWTSPT